MVSVSSGGEPGRNRSVASLLFIVCGASFVLSAAVVNTWTVDLAARAIGALLNRRYLAPDAGRVHDAQHAFLLIGAALLIAAWAMRRFFPLDGFFRKPLVEKLVLSVLVVAGPIAWLEVALRPFFPAYEKTTSLFVKDDRLGWKLRPGAIDNWGDVEVRVNERGFRGPVVEYEKPAGVARVLYLGDSVTFGFRVARWEDTYPFVTQSLIDSTNAPVVETVNLAVEGYSQWQQAIVLADPGDRYQPDVVVIGFVLNDVTEMFYLDRYGGTDEGVHLRYSYTSRWDRLLSKSALVYQIQNVVREVKARRKLGEDLRLGAVRQQALDVETLINNPDQPNVKIAWDIALADLQGIVDHCASRGVSVLVVSFPFTVQLSDPVGLSAPQRTLAAYARAREIETFDLLPPLAEHLRATGATPEQLFIDHDHLTVEGHRVVAGLLAPRLAAILHTRNQRR